MSVAAENKRRVLAALAALVILLATGFALGRATSGPASANAASRPLAAAAVTQRSPGADHDAAVTTLDADLANSRRARAATARQLANLHAASRRLRQATARADRVSRRARRCQRLRAARRYRRCVTEALR